MPRDLLILGGRLFLMSEVPLYYVRDAKCVVLVIGATPAARLGSGSSAALVPHESGHTP